MTERSIHSLTDLFTYFIADQYNLKTNEYKEAYSIVDFRNQLQDLWDSNQVSTAKIKAALISHFPDYKWMVLAELGRVSEMEEFIKGADENTFLKLAKATIDRTFFRRKYNSASPVITISEPNNTATANLTKDENRIILFTLLAQSQYFEKFLNEITPETFKLTVIRDCPDSLRACYDFCVFKLKRINTPTSNYIADCLEQKQTEKPNIPISKIPPASREKPLPTPFEKILSSISGYKEHKIATFNKLLRSIKGYLTNENPTNSQVEELYSTALTRRASHFEKAEITKIFLDNYPDFKTIFNSSPKKIEVLNALVILALKSSTKIKRNARAKVLMELVGSAQELQECFPELSKDTINELVSMSNPLELTNSR